MNQPTSKPKKKKFPINRPQTGFSMKANLVQNEPASVKRWDQIGLYQQLRDRESPLGPYWFHDGPPYANGSIHLGHLLNKVLKDFVVRSKTMQGYDVPYVPGWDCHGLPIEHKVMGELGDAARDMEAIQVRRKCKSYAEKHVKHQSKQMQRLLTVADYADPYLTMLPAFEGATLEVFAELVERGLVYRGLKPVHWSIDNQTALADAELEYYDRTDTSVYVEFEMDPKHRDGLMDEFVDDDSPLRDEPVYLMIWTTTPWTLPANVAVAVHPSSRYALTRMNGRLVIVAEELAGRVAGLIGDEPEILHVTEGFNLVGFRYYHPFLDRCPADPEKSAFDAEAVWTVVPAEYVTLEDGTGLVHTAPGHGVEDYQTGLAQKLPVYCPVQGDGTFDASAPDWLQGVSVWEGNKRVLEKLRDARRLFFEAEFEHSYPHDWRGKTPVIFRATEQWFVEVDKPFAVDSEAEKAESLRDRALDVTEAKVDFIPAWGRNRMRGMLDSRPDWCLSRQRAWGLPIPAFYAVGEDEPLLTAASVRAVATLFREKGSDVWFLAEPGELLKHYDPASDPDAPAWAKSLGVGSTIELRTSTDIFDVWWESGSSWNAVMRERFGADCHPTDLYLEGSDQHRGWFQLSLLPSLGATGRPPFKTVLTHGFMVDKDGKKMSKSLGNTVEVEDLMKELGADVCRWWVSGLNTDNDIKVDWDFFKLAGESYRKVRNTIRFLLGNLGDFDVAKDAHAWTEADATSVDAWAMGELKTLVEAVREAYDGLRFRVASERLYEFCNDTLSAVYLTATKDRLYCDAVGSPRRRRTQTAMHAIAEALVKLVAPLLPHTADEAWRAMHGEDACVHTEWFPEAASPVDSSAWAAAMAQREGWLKAMEDARQSQGIENPLDLALTVPAFEGSDRLDTQDLADLCGISRFAVGEALAVTDLREEPRCERSWKRDGTVQTYTDGEGDEVLLSLRDAQALGLG